MPLLGYGTAASHVPSAGPEFIRAPIIIIVIRRVIIVLHTPFHLRAFPLGDVYFIVRVLQRTGKNSRYDAAPHTGCDARKNWDILFIETVNTDDSTILHSLLCIILVINLRCNAAYTL